MRIIPLLRERLPSYSQPEVFKASTLLRYCDSGGFFSRIEGCYFGRNSQKKSHRKLKQYSHICNPRIVTSISAIREFPNPIPKLLHLTPPHHIIPNHFPFFTRNNVLLDPKPQLSHLSKKYCAPDGEFPPYQHYNADTLL